MSCLPIAAAINDSYLLPLAVLLDSLKEHLRSDVEPVLYLVHAGLAASTIATIASIITTRPIVLSRSQIAAAPRDARFPPEAAIPLLLADVLPRDLERVLFLDADMLVLDDVSRLWESPLDSCVLAAAPDGAVPRCSSYRGVKGWRELGIPADAAYFNGGVLLIHLERWRERDVCGRVRSYFERTCGAVDFLHQEALNAALWDDWKRLDSRWNLLASCAGRPWGRTPAEAWRHPGIVHFAGRMKPWRAPVGGPFNAAYARSLRRVASVVAPDPPTSRDRLQSLYDRHLRSAFYPLERLLWRHRLI